MSENNSISFESLPKKLNLGCGFDRREGFLNVDFQEFHKPDLVADVSDLSQLPSGHFEFILAQDVLEHLERDRVPGTLREWARLLEPTGVVEIRVPSLLDMFRLLSAPERRQPEQAREIIQLMYGTQAYNGDYHLSGFTAEVLNGIVSDFGLLISHANLKDEWLFEVRARKIDFLEDNSEFVHNAYFRILGRPVDPSGFQDSVSALNQGTVSRAEFEQALIKSAEARFLSQYPRYLWPYVGKTIGESSATAPSQSNALRRVVQKLGLVGR